MNYRHWIILLLLCFHIQFIWAQKQNLFSRSCHTSFQKGTIKNFLDDISHNTGVIIEYASNSIDTDKVVRVTNTTATLGIILQQVLKGQMITVIEKNNKIIFIPSLAALPEDAFTPLYSIFGFIKEETSEEPLADASIWEPFYRGGTITNAHGYFTLQLPEGKHEVWVSYAGHTAKKLELDLHDNTRIDVLLATNSEIQEVVISSDSKKKNDGIDKVYTEDPYNDILGQPDILRSLYLLPGVMNVPDAASGILVRGGSPDENVFLLDGNPVFNPTHLLGGLSIINRTSLKSIHLYKSNFPSRYGGGLSSVIDVFTKDGNMQKWQGEAYAGLLAGSFTIEGPIKKDRTSVSLSFRNSWVNPFLQLLKAGISVNFYDLHFKCTQLIGKKDKLMLNVYAGEDRLNLQQDNTNNRQQWGNKAVSLAWNRVLGRKAFLNSFFNISSYNNIGGFKYTLYDSSGNVLQNRVYNTFSSIKQYNAQSQVEFAASNRLKFNFGAKAAFTTIKPFDTNVASGFIDDPNAFTSFPPLSFREFVVFYENEIKASWRLMIRPGIHLSYFQFNDFHYPSIQPRLYMLYRLNTTQQLNFSFNHMTQYLHLVTNPYLGINSDAWIPSTAMLRPETSDMINFGYAYKKDNLLVSAEVYYKQLWNVTNYIDGKNLFLNTPDWEQSVQTGKGWTYGLELMADKKTDKWQIHLGYTLSWNWRQFKDVNQGEKFPFKYDRRHDLNIAAAYKLGKHWGLTALWMFATGDVYTLPDRIYPDFDNAQQISDPLSPNEYRLIYSSSTTNQYRTLPYHRLDISSSYEHKLKKIGAATLTMGVYNVYGSPSQYLYALEGVVGKRSLVVTTSYNFFNITPYLAYTIRF